MSSYFLVAVSNRFNLNTCLKYGLAGFTNSISGVWAYCDIGVGDFVSFLYGARVFNLYRVQAKTAILDAERMPPWPSIRFRSGRVYHFPFRLQLEPLREFCEPLVRAEFSYIAENLLLRGGYRKTHFQSDHTTLQVASQLGRPWRGHVCLLQMPPHDTFEPRFTVTSSKAHTPLVWPLQEVILQAAIRRRLTDEQFIEIS